MQSELDQLTAQATYLREALNQCDQRRLQILDRLQSVMDRIQQIRQQQAQDGSPFVVS